MYVPGDTVTYVGGMTELAGMPGVVQGPGTNPGRSVVVWPNIRAVLDMSDTVLKKDEREAPVPKIKLSLEEVYNVVQYADRTIDIQARDSVRGDIVIRADEQGARWLHANLCDMVKGWNKNDDSE
jgi:hypothetical protein